MENKPEGQEPQNTPDGGVTLTPEEIADLRHKADVSSQNFERAKKAEADVAALKVQLQTAPTNNAGEYSDEGKVLLGRISALEGMLSANQQKETMNGLEVKHPVLKERASEFETFKANPDNAGMSLATAAKAFLIENDLLVPPPPRKGVERATGGQRTPSDMKMTADDIAELRVNNYRKYSQMVREGKIDLG